MDLTKLSNEDLIALKENRIKDISDNGLLVLAGKEPKQAKQKKASKYEYDAASVGQPTEEEMAGGAEAQAEFRRVGGQAVRNLPGSTVNLVKDLATAVINPIDTATNVAQLGYGILQAIDPTGALPKDERSAEIATKVGEFYKQRYGSIDGVKKAIAEDPAGVLADVSSVLYGGGAALRGVGTIGSKVTSPAIKKISESVRDIGATVQKAGQVTDPLLQSARAVGTAGKIAGVIAPQALSVTTGAGAESFRQAYKAGKEGGERATQFRENITGVADPENVLNAAKQNLNVLRDLKSQQYRSGMVNIAQDKKILSFNGIDKALADAEKRTKFKGEVKDKAAFDEVTNAKEIVNKWKSLDPAEYHTPEGMDALKQSIGSSLEKLDPKTNSYNTINQVYSAVKSEIVKQAPVYANVMRDYTQSMDQIKEIERALSLGNKASADTAMRKLQSLMRDNVQTNYGQRVRLANQLEQQGGQMMMPGIAGQSLQSFVPRGISRVSGGGLTSYLGLTGQLPQAAASAVLSSPRLMGEAAYSAGQAAKGIGQVTKKAPFMLTPELYNLLIQSGNIQDIQE